MNKLLLINDIILSKMGNKIKIVKVQVLFFYFQNQSQKMQRLEKLKKYMHIFFIVDQLLKTEELNLGKF